MNNTVKRLSESYRKLGFGENNKKAENNWLVGFLFLAIILIPVSSGFIMGITFAQISSNYTFSVKDNTFIPVDPNYSPVSSKDLRPVYLMEAKKYALSGQGTPANPYILQVALVNKNLWVLHESHRVIIDGGDYYYKYDFHIPIRPHDGTTITRFRFPETQPNGFNIKEYFALDGRKNIVISHICFNGGC